MVIDKNYIDNKNYRQIIINNKILDDNFRDCRKSSDVSLNICLPTSAER